MRSNPPMEMITNWWFHAIWAERLDTNVWRGGNQIISWQENLDSSSDVVTSCGICHTSKYTDDCWGLRGHLALKLGEIIREKSFVFKFSLAYFVEGLVLTPNCNRPSYKIEKGDRIMGQTLVSSVERAIKIYFKQNLESVISFKTFIDLGYYIKYTFCTFIKLYMN